MTYFFCGEEIPYRRTMSSHGLTLGHFKEQLRKKGNYRCVHRQLRLGGAGGADHWSGNSCSFQSSGLEKPTSPCGSS